MPANSSPASPVGARWPSKIAARVLHSRHDDVTGSTWLQWVHTERLQHWAESGGATRQRMASAVADSLVQPEPVPPDAADCLAPLQWLLDHAAVGAPLTRDHYLAWALVVEAYERFGWFTMGKPPSSEAHTFELRVLRKLAQDMRLIRRSGKKLLLSTTGESVHAGGTEALWNATVACLLGFRRRRRRGSGQRDLGDAHARRRTVGVAGDERQGCQGHGRRQLARQRQR